MGNKQKYQKIIEQRRQNTREELPKMCDELISKLESSLYHLDKRLYKMYENSEKPYKEKMLFETLGRFHYKCYRARSNYVTSFIEVKPMSTNDLLHEIEETVKTKHNLIFFRDDAEYNDLIEGKKKIIERERLSTFLKDFSVKNIIDQDLKYFLLYVIYEVFE